MAEKRKEGEAGRPDEQADKEQPESIISREAYYEVSKTVIGEEETETGRLRVSAFVTTPATVSVKGGATINLGNYESARIDVMLSVPCYVEEIDEIFEKVKVWVDEKLAKEYQELKAAAAKR